MKFTNAAMTFCTLLILPLLSSMSLFVSGLPLKAAKRDIWDPRILSPNSTTVWTSGSTQEIIWDTSDAPANLTDPVGLVILGFADRETPVVLAHDFDIRAGSVSVTVPEVITGSDFTIVLFGDSSNVSPEFTIEGIE